MHDAISTFSQSQPIKINKGKKNVVSHAHFGPIQTTFLPNCGTLTFMKYLEQWNNGHNYRLSQKLQVGMCKPQSFISIWVSAHSIQSLSFIPEEILEPWLHKVPVKRPSKTLIRLLGCAG